MLRLTDAHPFTSIANLVGAVLVLDTKLFAASPRELSVCNMVRRVLALIREEAENAGLAPLFSSAMHASKASKHAQPEPTPFHPQLASESHPFFAVNSPASVTRLFDILSPRSSSLQASVGSLFDILSPPGPSLPTTAAASPRPVPSLVLSPVRQPPPGGTLSYQQFASINYSGKRPLLH